MKVSLKFDNVVTKDEDYLSDLIIEIVYKILKAEEIDRKVDSIIFCFQNGDEEEIR